MGSMSVNAFHEKAGRSQGNSGFIGSSWFFVADKRFSPAELAIVAMLPSALSRSESFRSVHVGRSQFSRCCHLFSDLSFHLEWNVAQAIDAVTGTRLWAFCLSSSWNDFELVLLFVFTPLPQRSLGCCCATVRTLLRSPRDDAAIRPAFWPWPRWLASCCFVHHAQPASIPSV